ncbi:MAG: type VI secretion system baseplate subunit TssK [Planctomycetes bacterium]|nr:type VI secretion system baseplate subunit TssK [Planctomycetota bacterium]
MAGEGQVHWHEGLFLQPHHLQAMQRHLLDRLAAERTLGWPYPYGVVEARLSADALENMQIQFDRLRVITKRGVEVDFPHSADLATREFKHQLEASGGALTVYLGVPLWYPTRGNAIEGGGADAAAVRRLYRVEPVDRADENTGQNVQTVMVRRINAMILFDSDDHADMEVLPLMRIVLGAGENVGVPRLDPTFAPASLLLSATPVLRETARDLAHQVSASRGELQVQLTRGGFSIETLRGLQLEQILRLRTLSRYAVRLMHLATAPAVSPFQMYLELAELLGDLGALHPDRGVGEIPRYDHDNPAAAFAALTEQIRPLLKGAVTASYDKVAFARDEQILVAALSDEQLSRPNEYFLGIRSNQDPRAIAQLAEDGDRFKLMARSMAHSNVYGLPLAEERHPPMELPSQGDLHYFRVNRTDAARMWERVAQDKALGLRWPDMDLSDFEITLFMTIPQGGAS